MLNEAGAGEIRHLLVSLRCLTKIRRPVPRRCYERLQYLFFVPVSHFIHYESKVLHFIVLAAIKHSYFCFPVPCTIEPPSDGLSSVFSSNGTVSDVRFNCDNGYTMIGIPSATCQTDGQLDQQAPTCGKCVIFSFLFCITYNMLGVAYQINDFYNLFMCLLLFI